MEGFFLQKNRIDKEGIMKRLTLLVVPFLILALAVGGAFAAGADDMTKGKGPAMKIDKSKGPGDLKGKDKGDLKGKEKSPGPDAENAKGKGKP
jgi:hypothetical protein